MQSFREDYILDWKMKVVDFVGHVVFGFIIWLLLSERYTPWVILFQWANDIFLYPRWIYSMCANRYVDSSHLIVRLHRNMHGLFGLFASIAVLAFVDLALGLNMLVHWTWDKYTHRDLRNHPRANQIL